MDVIVIELLLWAGLIFFFWALKDGLSDVETDIENIGLFSAGLNTHSRQSLRYDQPDKLVDAIGCYKDAPIYRYAIIGGQSYQFDHICTQGIDTSAQSGQRYIAPGLVYVPLET